MNKAAVIIGASSGLGRAMACQLAEEGNDCILIARTEKDLAVLATDLQIRFGRKIIPMPVDIGKLDAQKAMQLAEECIRQLPELDQLYITAAIIKEEDNGPASIAVLEEITDINYTGAAYLAGAFSEKWLNKDSNISVVSSIAAIRPRGRNIAYAASKAALEYYIKGIQHFCAGKPVRLQIYRIGYMDTGMSRGQKLLFKKVDPAKVAKHIIRRRNKRTRLSYYPRYWSLIALVMNMMPWFIYKKLKF